MIILSKGRMPFVQHATLCVPLASFFIVGSKRRTLPTFSKSGAKVLLKFHIGNTLRKFIIKLYIFLHVLLEIFRTHIQLQPGHIRLCMVLFYMECSLS